MADAGATTETTYDEVAYPSFSHSSAHPDVLAAIARVYGLHAADIAACRVLELGCGDGAHLIPIAEANPGSTFLGVDLSRRAIERGQADIAVLGLRNIRLEVADLTAWRPEPGAFDYVIAHGLYAWVPPPVQEAVMAVTGLALAEGGLAMISYNVAPGCNMRLMVRELLENELRGVESTAERGERGYAFLTQALEDISAVNHVSTALHNEVRRWAEMGPQSMLHDILSPAYTPARLTEVVAHARRHGLSYLGDADRGHLRRDVFPNEFDTRMLELSKGDVVEAEHRHDLRAGRSFRQTALRKGAPDFLRKLHSEAMVGMHASLGREFGEGANLGLEETGEWSMTFGTTEGFEAKVSGPAAQAAVRRLAEVFPGSAPVAALGLRGRSIDLLAMLYAAGAIKLWTQPLRATTTPGPRPSATAFARRQAATGRRVTRLDHDMISIDPMGAKLLARLDGRSTLPEIAASLGSEVGVAPQIVLGVLPENLESLGRRGVLLAD